MAILRSCHVSPLSPRIDTWYLSPDLLALSPCVHYMQSVWLMLVVSTMDGCICFPRKRTKAMDIAWQRLGPGRGSGPGESVSYAACMCARRLRDGHLPPQECQSLALASGK